jgi:selenocysteine-specific elongation factor
MMRTQRFEAVLTLEKEGPALPAKTVLTFQGQKAPASLRVYGKPAGTGPGQFFALVLLRRPLFLKWGDTFEILEPEKLEVFGRGSVLNPFPAQGTHAQKGMDKDFLLALCGGEESMLEALCRRNAARGLRERDILEFASLGRDRLLRLSQKLEEQGKVKILTFSPLFLISQESFDFLLDKIVRYLEEHHGKHPARKGVLLDRLKKRFGLSEKVLALAVKSLERAGKVRQAGQKLVLPSCEGALSAGEEKILGQLEEMCFRGEFQSLSSDDIRARFRLSPERLEKLLGLLIERRRVFQGPEGLYIHSRWLDEIISRVRSLGKKELTVAEFKAMTGLSRKYAIPLLELLDQMAVTRRKGPSREIL